MFALLGLLSGFGFLPEWFHVQHCFPFNVHHPYSSFLCLNPLFPCSAFGSTIQYNLSDRKNWPHMDPATRTTEGLYSAILFSLNWVQPHLLELWGPLCREPSLGWRSLDPAEGALQIRLLLMCGLSGPLGWQFWFLFLGRTTRSPSLLFLFLLLLDGTHQGLDFHHCSISCSSSKAGLRQGRFSRTVPGQDAIIVVISLVLFPVPAPVWI